MGYGINEFNHYQRFTSTTAIYPDSTEGTERAINYCILGLTNEAGEIAGKWKKYYRDSTSLDDVREQLLDELGDVMWYAARLADELGITLSEVAQLNENKLQSRAARGVLSGSGDNR